MSAAQFNGWSHVPALEDGPVWAYHYDYAESKRQEVDPIVEGIESTVRGADHWPPLEATDEVVMMPTVNSGKSSVTVFEGTYDTKSLADHPTAAGSAEAMSVADGVFRAETSDYEVAFSDEAFIRTTADDGVIEPVIATLSGDGERLLTTSPTAEPLLEAVPAGLMTNLMADVTHDDETFPELPHTEGIVLTITDTGPERWSGELAVLFGEDAGDDEVVDTAEALYDDRVEEIGAVEWDAGNSQLATASFVMRAPDTDDGNVDDSSDDGTSGDDSNDEETEAPAPDPAEWDDVSEIILAGHTSGWVGVEPPLIEGEQNPAIGLFEGRTYTIEWIDGDGATHNIEIRTETGEVVDGLATELTAEPDGNQVLEFEATEEMARYRCNPHPPMAGDIVVF
ncbi:cupredoxin domain-containing protein [Halovivax limisalsi]|uniref:cupredoxin domain-containing protein n=1 Tax=Halovivax limisalsi TaxID=1453760 RepID=UPI001FFC2C92|nr:hypothetical protein [Halovivax limisalsi]